MTTADDKLPDRAASSAAPDPAVPQNLGQPDRMIHRILMGEFGQVGFPKYRDVDFHDYAKVNEDIRKGWGTWVKPLPVMLGFGLPGLLLFFGSLWLDDLNAALDFPLGHYLGW